MDNSISIKALRNLYPATPQRRVEGLSATTDKTGRKPAGQALQLSPSEIRQVEQLQRRDRAVRSHELAHKAIVGQYARGAPNYAYRIGPDGRRYAVGGEVSIDISKANDPKETLHKAERIRRAAMAPAHPSMQDRQIALQASVMAAEARQALLLKARQADAKQPVGTAVAPSLPQTPDPVAPKLITRHAIISINRTLNSDRESHASLLDQLA